MNIPDKSAAATTNTADYTVSVVIPAYNAAEFIARAIDSVLKQSLCPDEIIVVDDGSTDATAEIIRRYGSRIHYIHRQNSGASVARNTGIKAAASRWIAFLDADDQWLPSYLQKQLELLRRNPELVWTTGNFIRYDCQKNRQTEDLTREKAHQTKKLLNGREYFSSYFDAYMVHGTGCTITKIIKREALLEAGLFLPGQPRFNDEDMWFRIAYRWGPMGYLTEPLAIYHTNVPQSLTRKHHPLSNFCGFAQRHLILADKTERAESARTCIAAMLKHWIRDAIIRCEGKEARNAIKRFAGLLPMRFKIRMYLRSLAPRTSLMLIGAAGRVKLLILKKSITRKNTPGV